LLRVVRTPDGHLAVGRTLPGRGAWLCPDTACLLAARRRRAFERALRGPLAPDALGPLEALVAAAEAPSGPPPPAGSSAFVQTARDLRE